MLGRLIFLALALVAMITFADWASSPVAPCEAPIHKHSESREEKQTAEEYCSTGKVVSFWRAIGSEIDSWHDDLTAIATVVIAAFTTILGVFTIRLANSNRITAEAAEKSASTLPVIEGAYVYPDIITNFVPGGMSAFNRSTTVQSTRLVIDFMFKNFGRTPAIIQFYRADLNHPDQNNLRSADADSSQIVKKTILGAGEPTEKLQAEITDFLREEWLSVNSGKSHIYFTGEIRYADIWGDKWVFCFDWVYSPSQYRFIPDNQVRKKIT
jgi:hypothetical protein